MIVIYTRMADCFETLIDHQVCCQGAWLSISLSFLCRYLHQVMSCCTGRWFSPAPILFWCFLVPLVNVCLLVVDKFHGILHKWRHFQLGPPIHHALPRLIEFDWVEEGNEKRPPFFINNIWQRRIDDETEGKEWNEWWWMNNSIKKAGNTT